MFTLLNRITWLLSICAWLYIWSIDGDLFILGLIAAIAVKYIFFSPAFIKEALWELKTKKAGNIKISDIEQTPVLKEAKQENTVSNPEEKKETAEIKIHEQTIAKNAHRAEKTKVMKPKEPGVFEKFFAENLIAKIGGIILFIGVLTFLVGIYSVIGPVAKITIGFIIGFALFGVWVWLENKNFTQESRTVMGISILVNYLVILAGRHILGETGGSDIALLSAGITFFLLILNTLFAVVVSLVYSSRNLLIFAFAAAYINPLLLGTSSEDPYVLLGYTMIVTLGAMYLSFKKKEALLFPLSFTLAAFMLIIAPWSDATGWVTKLICINLLGAMWLYVSSVFKKTYQYIYEFLIAGIFFLIGIMWLIDMEHLSSIHLAFLGLSSLGLMSFCYFFMHRAAYMYSIWTLWATLTLLPALTLSVTNKENIELVLFIVLLFAGANIEVVLTKSKKLISENLPNLMMGLISGALFLGYMVYFIGNEYFPGTMQGFAFLSLAAIYAIVWFLFITKIWIDTVKKDEKTVNVFYSISALAVSFFSLAVAFVFANTPEIISIIWLLEASVVWYVAGKTASTKVALWGLVIFIIWVIRLLSLLETSFYDEYGMLVWLAIVLASLIWNLMIFKNSETKLKLSDEFYAVHHFFHIITACCLAFMSLFVLDFRNEWLWILYLHGFASCMCIVYKHLESKALSYVSYTALIWVYGVHIIWNMFAVDNGFFGAFKGDMMISLLILALAILPFAYEYVKKGAITSKVFGSITCLYVLIITSLYVIQLFEVTFALTLYWGILSFAVLALWISKEVVYMRTIWLYLLCLTVGKIFLHDIWQPGVDDGVGFIAFMLTGWLMIALSTMYTKKYGNTLGKDFSPSNILGEIGLSGTETTTKDQNSSTKKVISDDLMGDIKKVKIWDTIWVRMRINGNDKPIQIRAENLIKIAKLITKKYWKTSFKAGELQDTYELITKDYKSELPANQYKRITEIVKMFVDNGWEIEFVS